MQSHLASEIDPKKSWFFKNDCYSPLMNLFLTLLLFPLLLLSPLSAQNPGAKEDLESERRKVLRTADLVDSIQTSQEQLQSDIADLKAKSKTTQEQLEITQSENQKLRSDLLTLKTAIEKSEEARLKERDLLLKEIGTLFAEKTKSYPQSNGDALLKVRDEEFNPKKPEKESSAAKEPKEKGFYHVVEKGHTLSGIADAFKQQGVNVTVDEIRKANNLSKKETIHVGQKLFIPKK